MISPLKTDRLPAWLQGLLVALSIWCVFLAVGAAGIFGRGGLAPDLRRTFIVLACSATFLGGWYFILVRRRSRRPESPDSGSGWNQASLLSLASAINGFVVWATAWLMRSSPPTATWTEPLGYLSAFLFTVATIMSLVGLSQPRRLRGQLAGLVTLALLLLAVVLFVIQVQTYARRRLSAEAFRRPPEVFVISVGTRA